MIVEFTLWRIECLVGEGLHWSILFATADPSGADATLETAKRAAVRPIPEGARLISITRVADSIRGTAVRLGEAST